LVKKGANVNAAQSAGLTPLHKAAQKGHVEIAQILMKAGADANLKNKEGKTAAELAHGDSVLKVLKGG